MNAIRLSLSSVLGLFITFGLVFVMFKLIDSGNKDMDEENNQNTRLSSCREGAN